MIYCIQTSTLVVESEGAMQFNFDRSVVLGSARVEGNTVVIATMFHGEARIPRDRVHMKVTDELNDSSTRVVDFGDTPTGTVPHQVIIAAGHRDSLPRL